jgi:hypothetical protein
VALISRFAGGYKRRLPLDRWPGLWPDLRAAQRSPAHEEPHYQAVCRYHRLSPGDSIELHLGALRFELSGG